MGISEKSKKPVEYKEESLIGHETRLLTKK